MDVAKARKEEITYSMIEILYKAFEIKTANLETENNNPFKQAFLSNMDYNDENDIRNKSIFFSIIKWLNDSIAMQKFFEKTAHILSDGEKREYTSQKLGNLNLSTVQKNN
ncbi:MAG: TdeIII family type II restriction endonuclease, partial [Firmicutes bacterium]|nr:TdeIII family type II restriction endonuclease [Bacillota bacterium]